jgi:hypothetical protein
MKGMGDTRTRGRRGERLQGLMLFGLSLAVFLSSACSPNPSIANSGKDGPAPVTGERPPSVFEKDLETLRTANIEYIFSLRRKDGGVMAAEDKRFIRENKKIEFNRILLTDDDKAIIAGSNYPFPPEMIKALQSRFDFQDYSTKPIETANTSNGNIPVNGNKR